MRKKLISKRILAAAVALTIAVGTVGCGGSKSDKGNPASEEISGSENYELPQVDTSNDKDTAVTDGSETAMENCILEDVSYDETCSDIDGYVPDLYNTNEYSELTENPWMSVKTSPLSTFAADVDTASYTNLRSSILNGYAQSSGEAMTVRIEEMINYFHYDYDTPKEGEKFAVHTEYADCPWNDDTKLALVALNTEKIDFKDAPESNLVFLIDVSGSMFDGNKLPLIQQSMCMLAENLTEKDRVSIVTYAGEDAVVLEGETGDNYYEIASAIEKLEAGGSTNGAAGIETAYEIAEKYYIEGGNNRIILATDGDLNVGVTSEDALERLITDKRKTGVFLSVLGVGYGNYKDNKLEILADRGNGNYAYIDSIYEAKKALVDDMGATMVTVAKDVKLQVEFNPEQVKGYRLIGYENRAMAAEEFSDDTKDGGEMGAGHSVTAIYEIALKDSEMEINEPELKYGNESGNNDTTVDRNDYGDELFTVNVRYKEPDKDKSRLESFVCTDDNYSKNGSDNLRWAAAAAAFGMTVMDSEYKENIDDELILKLAYSVRDVSEEKDEYKLEFIKLVNSYFGIVNDDGIFILVD